MDNKLLKIMTKINLDESYFTLFSNAKILKNKIDDLENIVFIELSNDGDIPYELYDELVNKFSSFFDGATIDLKIINNIEKSDNFSKNFYKVLNNSYEQLSNVKALEEKMEIIGNTISVCVVNERQKIDLEEEFDKLKNILLPYGSSFTFNITIDENIRIGIEEKIDNETTEIMNMPYIQFSTPKTQTFKPRRKKEVDDRTIFGNLIKEDEAITKISSIVGENNEIVIEAKVFGTEEFVPQSKAFKILTLKVSDGTDSILSKIFIRGDDVYDEVVKKTKPGTWIKIKGSTKRDEYAKNELVLTAYDIYESDRKDKKLVDDAPVKRVELHAHTMMSQMDGVTKLDLDNHTCELITNAIDMGYSAVAVTDHSGCQAFPIVYELITGSNKGKIKKLKGKKEELETKLAAEENEDQKKVIENDL